MINFLLGTIGSGKSYEAVAFHIIPAIRAGRKVITNMPLRVEKFAEVFPDQADLIKLVNPTKDNPIPFRTLADYADGWRHPETNIGPLYVIDECHKCLPRGRTEVAVDEWFAESRHELCDVLLITQSYGKISRPIVDLVHLVYRVRKNLALGAPSQYIRKVQDGVRGEVVNETIRTYKPEFFEYYNSHTKTGVSASEALPNDVIPIWRHWSFIGAGLFLLLGVGLLSMAGNPFSSDKPPVPSKPAPAVASHLPKAPIPIQPPPVVPDHPFYKLRMHIAGFIESEDKSRFMYTVSLSQNGQPAFTMTTLDLIRAGYSIKSHGPCALRVSYGSYTDYLTCDAPRVDLQPGTSVPTVKPTAWADESSGGHPPAGGAG